MEGAQAVLSPQAAADLKEAKLIELQMEEDARQERMALPPEERAKLYATLGDLLAAREYRRAMEAERDRVWAEGRMAKYRLAGFYWSFNIMITHFGSGGGMEGAQAVLSPQAAADLKEAKLIELRMEEDARQEIMALPPEERAKVLAARKKRLAKEAERDRVWAAECMAERRLAEFHSSFNKPSRGSTSSSFNILERLLAIAGLYPGSSQTGGCLLLNVSLGHILRTQTMGKSIV